VLESDEDNTVVSRAMTGKPARMIKNAWVEEFEASGLKPLQMPLQGLLAYPVMDAAEREGRKDINPGFAGQGIGLVDRIRPAAEVVAQMVREARAILTGGLAERVQVGAAVKSG